MSEGMRDVPTDNVGRKIADEIETDSFGVSNRDATARKINAALSSSQARLYEAVKVLEEIAQMPGVNGGHHDIGEEFRNTQSLRLNEQCRALAKRFLATIGEET